MLKCSSERWVWAPHSLSQALQPHRGYLFLFACSSFDLSIASLSPLAHVARIENGALIAQRGLHLLDFDGAVVGQEGGRDPGCLSRCEGRSHDAQTGAALSISIGSAAGGEQVRGIAASEAAEWNRIGRAVRRELKCAPECSAIVPLDAPGAQRHGIGSLSPIADVLPLELFDSVDVA